MPKWKRNATEFTVGVNHNEVRGYQTSIPKPIAEVLGNPETVTYVLKGKKVELKSGTSEEKNEPHAQPESPHTRSTSSGSSGRP